MNTIKVNHNGRWYTIYKQEWGQDCGPTCVAMAKLCLTGVGSDIEWLRKHTKAKLVSPAIEARIQSLGMKSRDQGTYTINLPPLAKSIGLQAEYKFVPPSTLLSSLQSSGHNKVFICHINWDNQGGHFVVVPHVGRGNEVVVLDPYYGLQTTTQWPRYPGGYFTGNVVEVRR